MEQLRKVAFCLPVSTKMFKSSMLLPSSGGFFVLTRAPAHVQVQTGRFITGSAPAPENLPYCPVQKDQVKLVPCQSHHTILILLLISQMYNSHFSIQLIFGQLLTSLHHRFTLSRNRFPLLSHQYSVALFTHLVPQTPYVKLYNLFC